MSLIVPATTQPQSGLTLAPYWAARGVVAAVPHGGVFVTSRNQIALPSATGIAVRGGVRGRALSDGGTRTTAYVPLAPAESTTTVWDTPTSQITVFAYILRRGNNANGNAPIFMNGSPSNSPYSFFGLIDGSGTGNLTFECDPGAAYVSCSSATGFTTGAPQFVCGVYDGAALRLYSNGVQIATQAATGNLSAFNGAGTRGAAVGNYYNYTVDARSFNGDIYLVGISPKALTPGEVKALSDNPWGLFQRPVRMMDFEVAASAGHPTMARFAGVPGMKPGARQFGRGW